MIEPVLLAYIDEIGEPGAFVSRTHARYKTSPAFGYAGFVIPEGNARQFGREFTIEKRRLFKTEIEEAPDPGKWERKGADLLRPRTPDTHPQHTRVFRGLVAGLERLGGALFYYADQKPIGTPKQTRLDVGSREQAAMKETLNRLCRHADGADENLLVMIDQINEADRAKRLPNMYGHILSRAAEREEMLRIVEPPMHIDSVLSSNIQFADWVAAAVSRSIDYQLIEDSQYGWVPGSFGRSLRGKFTHESKLHLWHRSVPDLNHSDIVKRTRPLFPAVEGQTIGSQFAPQLEKVHEAAIRAANRK
ncbi:DUF3800 domain-containing protein [Agromyces mangrovi Wang et al. 2018]|uniref:DUF3800 domain-containing protein n=1 Tax=Agromyces mangrovi TaxID=1858653 RepID=UPI0025747800|nr:DUF3800 domain-containing protein [Agromyces mangrovi]